MKKINLAVIFGGKSGEHEVSLSSAKSVINALNKEKYNIIPIAITKKGNWLTGDKGAKYMETYKDRAGKEGAISLDESQSLVTIKDEDRGMDKFMEGDMGGVKIDLVLPILHGPYGEDGRLQGMLDTLGVPYVFSGVLAHALAMNKPKAKVIAASVGVTTPKFRIIEKDGGYNLDELQVELGLPLVIKPSELGSSVGISIAKTDEELKKGIEDAFKYGKSVMLEQFVKGRELTATIMEDGGEVKALPIIEIIPKTSEWFDYKAKYEVGATEEVCPAEVPDEIRDRVQESAVNVFKAIGCEGLSRADFIWSKEDDKIYFLEINTIPGMTATSLAPQAAEAEGMNFSEFLDRLIEGARK